MLTVSDQRSTLVYMASAHSAEVSQIVKDARHKQGITLARLAEVTGLSESYIWRIEKGQRSPARQAAVKIANALDIEPELLGFTDAEGNDAPPPAQPTTGVVTAVMSDPQLTGRQKTALLTVYYSYVEG